jgi:hypothetical protein
MALHTCPPPDLDEWFEEYPSVAGSYVHMYSRL